MTRSAFEKLVREALKSLPKKFKTKLQNVDIVIEEGTGREETLGLYEGIPLKDRTQDYSMALPDKITLFKKCIEAHCRERRLDIQKEIRHTVCHEIGHHFGMTDERMQDLGVY